jgi:phosphoglycolate phosphatase
LTLDRLPDAVLFDWDGTLVDNWPVIHGALNATLVAFGHAPWTMAETMERISRSQRDSFPLIFGERWEEARDLFYARFQERHLADLVTFPGAVDLLRLLAEAGTWMGIVSNKRGDFLRLEAAHLGWESFFGRIVGATDAVEDKPSAAPVRLALADSGLPSDARLWFVGDTSTDVLTARAVGCPAILVRHPGGSPVPLQSGVEPDLTVHGLAGLTGLVGSLQGAI